MTKSAQTIRNLLQTGAEAAQIIYITSDHPLLKLSGMKKTLEAWEELFPGTSDKPQFLFLDEVQFVPDWQVWLKHQVDFQKRRKIAIPGSILLLGQKLLERPDRLGNAVETAFFKHVFTRFYQDQPTFSYWQSKGRKNYEVDLIAEIGDRTIPFEVKYQDKQINDSDLKGLRMFMEERNLDIGYVITRNPDSLSVRQPHSTRQKNKTGPFVNINLALSSLFRTTGLHYGTKSANRTNQWVYQVFYRQV